MKSRFLYLATTGLFLMAGCIKHPTETQNIGNFALDFQMPADALSPVLFKKYTVPYTTGKDMFASIRASTRPDGFIDSSFVNNSLQAGNGTVTVYFIKTGACMLHIEGLTDDNRPFRDSTPLTVRNPFSITGETRIGAGDPFPTRYSLVPLPAPDSMALHAQTEWSINGVRKTLGAVNSPYDFTTSDSGTFTLVAAFTDTAQKVYAALDTLVIHAPGRRPVVDSIALLSSSMNAGDKLTFNLFSGDLDSNLSRIIIQDTKNRWSDTLVLTNGSPYPALLAMRHPLTDTGTFTFSLFAEDSSGLISNAVSGTITVVANPPRVRFIPDQDTLKAAINFPTRLNVTQGAATYVWTVDGVEETGTDAFLQRTFLTPTKKTSTITVYGIDKYNYKGPVASVVLVEETNFYDLSWGHLPADSVFRDSAYWEVRTSRYDRVTANQARFYWTIERLTNGETLYKTTVAGDSVGRLRIDTIQGINFDNVDIKVTVILKDSLAAINTSPLLENTTKLRLFRPRMQLVSVAPRSDSVSTGVPFTIKFKASDVNTGGRIDAISWKYADSATVKQLSPADTTITLTWTAAGKPTVCIWARDNDGQRSDTLKTTLVVVKNQPRVTALVLYPSVVYTNETCTLSVSVQKGFSGSRIDSVRIIGPGIAAAGIAVGSVIKFGTTFANPGWQKLTVKVYDFLRDSSIRVDSVNIASGKPTVIIRSVSPHPDSISAKVQATFKYTVSTARTGFIDSVFWKQTGSSTINRLKVQGSDSTFKYTWMDSGRVTIEIWARDNVGNISNTFSHPLIIVKSRPSIAAFIVPQGTPPTKLSYNYTISARRGFSRARITNYHWVYPSGTGLKDSMQTDSIIKLSFSTANAKIIAAYVVDSLGDTSAQFIDTITIDPGLPVVKSVIIDTSASGNAVFVNDQIVVKNIAARDTNGPIVSYKVVLVNGTYKDSAMGPIDTLYLKVPVGNAGTCSLSVFVKDDDNQWSAPFPVTPIKLNVRAAKPVVTGFTPPAALWIYDTLTFSYSASDTNGGLSKVVFNWKDGSKNDTVPAQRKDSVQNRTIKHYYDTAGTFAVTVTAMDDDNQTGNPRTNNITIDEGRPTVSVKDNNKDTIIVSYPYYAAYTADSIHFVATAKDTNGTLKDKYSWYLTPPFDIEHPDSLITTTNTLTIDQYSNFWSVHSGFNFDTTYVAMVKVEDNDGIPARDTFYLYYEPFRKFMDLYARCKNGQAYWNEYSGQFERDHLWFEFSNDPTTGLDSIEISCSKWEIPFSAGQYYQISMQVMIEGGLDYSDNFVAIYDLITISDLSPILSNMRYEPSKDAWIKMWRPPLNFFSAYRNRGLKQLNFSIVSKIYSRTGIEFQAISAPYLRINYTF